MHKHSGTVHKVAKDSHKFIVIASLEIFPGEVVVFRLRSVGCQHIAEHVLLAGELAEIFVEPYSPVARCGNLVVFKVEELVCRDVVGKIVATVCHEHCREDDAMEHDIVFANKVEHTCFRIFPPFFPVLGISVYRI